MRQNVDKSRCLRSAYQMQNLILNVVLEVTFLARADRLGTIPENPEFDQNLQLWQLGGPTVLT